MVDEVSDSTITLESPDPFKEIAVYSNYRELYEEALEAVEDIRSKDVSSRHELYKDNSDNVQKISLFFLWNNLLLEEIMVSLIESRLIGIENMTSDLSEYLHGGNMRFHHYRNFLFKSGIVDEGLNGEIKRNRRTRNHLVHNAKRLVALDFDHLDVEHIDSEIERSHKTLLELYDL